MSIRWKKHIRCDPRRWLDGQQNAYPGWRDDYNKSRVSLPFLWGQESLFCDPEAQYYPFSSRVYRCATRPPGTRCTCYHVIAGCDRNPEWMKRVAAPWPCGCHKPLLIPLTTFLQRMARLPCFLPFYMTCCMQLGVERPWDPPEYNEDQVLLIEAPRYRIPKNHFWPVSSDNEEEDPGDSEYTTASEDLPEDPNEHCKLVMWPLSYCLESKVAKKKTTKRRRDGPKTPLTDCKYARRKRQKSRAATKKPKTTSSSSSSSSSSSPPLSPVSPVTSSTESPEASSSESDSGWSGVVPLRTPLDPNQPRVLPWRPRAPP